MRDRFHDPERVRQLAARIGRRMTRGWRIMEVCGGQTHAIVRYGIDELIPAELELIHGPGCPVCVTPIELIDRACELACTPGVRVCSFGDMLRVPGSSGDLHSARARGGRVQIVYSPLDALAVARAQPDTQIVFFAVGFETTAPATALSVARARAEGLRNFSLLVAHVRVPPALEALLDAPEAQVDGFLAAGHVCSVMGLDEYAPLCERYHVPIVATGFTPVDLLEGLLACVDQLEVGRAEVVNQYARAVASSGNRSALELIRQVFQVEDRCWRGLGSIRSSGLALRAEFAEFDAEHRFALGVPQPLPASRCWSARVLRGEVKPTACPEFGRACQPLHPLGAPMVSDEGACAAYYRYRAPGAVEASAVDG